MKRAIVLSVLLSVLSCALLAQNKNLPQKGGKHKYGITTCPGDPIIVPDGWSGYVDTVSANTTNYYFEQFVAGHSYAVEIWDSYDAYHGISPVISLLTGCASGPAYTDVAALDPAVTFTFSDRISFIQGSETSDQIAVTNPDTVNGYVYYYRAVDTTLHNPRWSTYSGYTTQYSFVNNTASDIQGVLTVTLGDTLATQTVNITVPAGAQVFEFVSSSSCGNCVNVGPNHAGFAQFAYIGPAGGVEADAYFINADATVVVPSTFNPRNYQH